MVALQKRFLMQQNDREKIISAILDERSRQLDLPRTEYDSQKNPNDWASIAGHYLFENSVRGGSIQDSAEIELSFIKAAAVIIAALEHMKQMKEDGYVD